MVDVTGVTAGDAWQYCRERWRGMQILKARIRTPAPPSGPARSGSKPAGQVTEGISPSYAEAASVVLTAEPAGSACSLQSSTSCASRTCARALR